MSDIEKLNSVKFNIRKALESQGSDITADIPFEEYPSYIMEMGSGDGENPYTTATVTITNNHRYDQTVALAWLNTEDGMIQSFVTIGRNGGTKTVSAILYDGKCYATYEGSGSANVTGNVVFPSPNPGFILTGDATITIINDR